jgi:DNA-binding NarL/FixJ family response regulator
VRDVAAEQREATEDLLAAVMDREPGPEEAAILMDQIAAVLKGLPEGYCRVLELRLQGRSAAEIAARLGMVRQTVYRHMTVLKQRMQKNL